MALRSKLFQGDGKLEACAVQDSAHVTPGARGDHVGKIQRALVLLDEAVISANEVGQSLYGPSTAAGVLRYKQRRNIINRSYETTADNIVGKMTIVSLDNEMVKHEGDAGNENACILRREDTSTTIQFGIAGAPPVAADSPGDVAIMQGARATSLLTLNQTINALNNLKASIIRQILPGATPLTDDEKKLLAIAGKWLLFNPGAPVRALSPLTSATISIRKNINLKNAAGGPPRMRRVPEAFHGLTFLNDVESGIQCGRDFFEHDGPNCRRDVITHEYFHMVGIKHGGSALNGPTIRTETTTTGLALDSADHLTQLIAEFVTLRGVTDACLRRGE
jgi:hypothetical protein